MEPSDRKLEEAIAQLERGIELLESKVVHARWQVQLLHKAKAPNARFLFWEWQIRYLSSKTVAERFEHVLGILDVRAAGQWNSCEFQKENVPGVSAELLYLERRPTIPEVYQLLKAATGFSSNAQIVEMFVTLKDKPHYWAITDYFWAEFDA